MKWFVRWLFGRSLEKKVLDPAIAQNEDIGDKFAAAYVKGRLLEAEDMTKRIRELNNATGALLSEVNHARKQVEQLQDQVRVLNERRERLRHHIVTNERLTYTQVAKIEEGTPWNNGH